MQTDKGLVLAAQALETLRQRQIILPALTVVERACAEAVIKSNTHSIIDKMVLKTKPLNGCIQK